MPVFVLDKRKKPLMPCSEKRARLLLARGQAVIHRRYPFTIRLKNRTGGALQPVSLKLDPGADTTGVALVREAADGHHHVLHLAEIAHRSKIIREKMHKRSGFRRRRRSANLRYRAERFHNRRKPKGWLPPSLQSRVNSTSGWVERYRKLAPLTSISLEHTRFDTQRMENPEISGVEYQQGTLAGYEIREYLLEKWGRKCAYCRAKKKPLQIDHIRPKTHGGSDRVSNLALACETCNRKKGSLPVERFLARKPERLRRVLAQTKKPLRTAAAVNATRWALAKRLEETGLPVKLWSGGRTKWNRMRFGIPKEYCLDAACVGSLEGLHGWNKPVYCIRCMGRGRYRRTRSDSLGFPLAYFMRRKTVHGFQTGDLVRAVVPRGKNAGVVVGRVAVRAKGRFDIQTPAKVVQSISWKYCTVLARADGHSYHTERRMRLLSPRCKVSCADDNVRDSAAD